MITHHDFPVVQAVADCMSGNKLTESMQLLKPSQLQRALEYFNLPECMWPVGLLIPAILTTKCEVLARAMMNIITTDLIRATAALGPVDLQCVQDICLIRDPQQQG